ncbi:MAG: cobaltochelatase subunit CobN [Candidatus Hodgkinia cicadicola]
MEVLVCCDSWLQYNHYARILKASAVNRLFKLVLLGCGFNELEYLMAVSSYCVLLIANVFGKLKLKQKLLILIERLSAKFNFKACALIEEDSTRCFCYSSGLCSVDDWASLSAMLAKWGAESLIVNRSRLCWRARAELLWPLRCYVNTALVCAYNSCAGIWCDAISSVCNRLMFYRVRALLFCVKTVSAQADLAEYKLALCEFAPLVVISLTSFVCVNAIKAHKSAVFQLAMSCERLSKLICLSCGLTKSELCKQLKLPEMEGKVFVRALGFAAIKLDLSCGVYARVFRPVFNRLNFIIKALLRWLELISSASAFVFVIFNYPSSDARIGNGVGLDTFASTINVHNLLTQRVLLARAELINKLLLGVTNYSNLNRVTRATMCLRSRAGIINDITTTQLWGKASVDPFVINEFSSLSVYRVAKSHIMIQPTRGYGLVNPSVYHSAFVVPCRLYWMSYAFCARVCASAMLINVGKHGSLEWLPGRPNVLSRSCYPELVGLGLPNLYFYIVNDPGEGTQAKRRTSSVIIDHFLPPFRALGESVASTNSETCANYNKKYYCNLLGLQFRSGLHIYGFLEKPSVVISLLLLLDWRLNLSVAHVCKRAEIWNLRFVISARNSFYSLYSAYPAIRTRLMPLLALKKPILLVTASCFYEVYSIIKSANIKFVLPGLSSAFSRADCDVLPTGRNFFSKNVLDVPTPWAYSVSTVIINKLLRAYYNRSCHWLKSVGISVWATSNMRTGGDDIAIILRLIGVKPIWETNSYKVIGFEVLPLMQMRFPRVSVLIRLSGLFRDTYYQVVDRLYRIFEVLTCLSNASANKFSFESLKCDLFSSELGCYGTGIQELLDSGNWSSTKELVRKYVVCSGYRYNGLTWKSCAAKLVNSLARTQVVLQSQDNREHDILDSDDYYQFEGGMNAAVRCFSSKVCGYHIDTSFALKPSIKLRRLKYEIDRALKCKLLNKTWVLSMLEHGYRGVSEILASLSYFCSFAATTFQVSSSQFMAVFKALIADLSVKTLIALNSAYALTEIKQKLLEVIRKNVWTPASNCIRLCLET